MHFAARLASWAGQKLDAVARSKAVSGLLIVRGADPRWTTTPADPAWASHFIRTCESPAETAFLEAIIQSFQLTPEAGVLQGNGLTLRLQESVPPFRLDFLANDWLAIEIDGATYHSTPEAFERDKDRDHLLVQEGYTVLRIPAKTVFEAPQEAVSRVRSALARAPTRRRPSFEETLPKKLRELGALPAAVARGLSGINKQVHIASEVQRRTAELQIAVERERQMLHICIEGAVQHIKTEAFFAEDEGNREAFKQAYDRISNAVEARRGGSHANTATADASHTLSMPLIAPETVLPPTHEDPDIEKALRVRCEKLMADRTETHQLVRERLHQDTRLQALVKSRLIELGHPACWRLVAP